MMQGMSMRQLKQLLLIENMLIGLGSICIGILIGLIFSKLVLLISASVLMISNGLLYTSAGCIINSFHVSCLIFNRFVSYI